MFGSAADFSGIPTEDDSDVNDKVNEVHVQDNIILFMYLFLLGCVVLTKWLLTVKKVSFVHESGLALLYGKKQLQL